jgi:hypothetical protein
MARCSKAFSARMVRKQFRLVAGSAIKPRIFGVGSKTFCSQTQRPVRIVANSASRKVVARLECSLQPDGEEGHRNRHAARSQLPA